MNCLQHFRCLTPTIETFKFYEMVKQNKVMREILLNVKCVLEQGFLVVFNH